MQAEPPLSAHGSDAAASKQPTKFTATSAVPHAGTGTQCPTALAWLRRRGPPLPLAVLHRLFRQRQVRLLPASAPADPAAPAAGAAGLHVRLARVRPGHVLQAGERLLVPTHACVAMGEGTPPHKEQPPAAARGPSAAAGASFAQEQRRQMQDVRRMLLAWTPDLLVLNKPAGMDVHGPAGLARLAVQALSGLPGDAAGAAAAAAGAPASRAAAAEAEAAAAVAQGGHGLGGLHAANVDVTVPQVDRRPRLVHRLDRCVSGALVMARGPDAAAWLAQAFRAKSHQAAYSSPPTQAAPELAEAAGGGLGEPSVYRMYWALVNGVLRPGASGTIRMPLPADLSSWRGVEQQRDHLDHAARAASRSGTSTGAGALPGAPAGEEGDLLAAVTRYKVLASAHLPGGMQLQPQPGSSQASWRGSDRGGGGAAGVSWLQLEPGTGRRHQLRLHCAYGLGAPICGDTRYGHPQTLSPPPAHVQARRPFAGAASSRAAAAAAVQEAVLQGLALGGIMLHARRLRIRVPHQAPAGKPTLSIDAPLPRYMARVLHALGWLPSA